MATGLIDELLKKQKLSKMSYILVNVFPLGFRLLIGQNKTFNDITLDLMAIFHSFQMFYRPNKESINGENNGQIKKTMTSVAALTDCDETTHQLS